jgi:hypothetical protein
MPHLEEISKYRETIIEKLLADAPLKKALGIDSFNALTQPIPSLGDLNYKRIFPYKKNLNAITTEQISAITMELATGPIINDNFNDISINLFILVHESNILLIDQGQTKLRTDFLADRIHKVLGKSRDFARYATYHRAS